MTIPLPPYEAPFLPVPQVTPLSYRDGLTMLKKLDAMTRYINKDLVPWVNENYSELAEEFQTQVNILVEAVNEAIESVINGSVTVQDPIIAQLINTADSLTRVALNGIFQSISGLDSAVAGKITAPSTTRDALDKRYGDWINVKAYGAVGDGIANDSTAILAAAAAAGQTGILYFPKGTYLFNQTITGVRGIRGDGRARTTLQYAGITTAIRLSTTVGTRTYHGSFEEFLLRTQTSGLVGIDLEAHSNGLFQHIAVQGFGTGFYLASTIDDGGCLYNTFIHCEAVTCAKGWHIASQSSNENRLISCRSNGCTDAAVHITHGNHNHMISCAFESGADGVRIEGGTSSDANVIAFTRFEMNSADAIQIDTGVRDTTLLFPKIMSTGGAYTDLGLRTKYLPALSVSSNTAVVRNRNTTTDPTMAAFEIRDDYSLAGDPITTRVVTERFTGKFMSFVRGGVERAAINAEGAIRPASAVTASLPSPSRAGVGGMAFNTTTNRPVWSDGTAWRYADGTAV